MIRGYPAWPSVLPGGTLVLHVATDAPQFDVAFHRWGDGFERVAEVRGLPGIPAAEAAPEADWQWPAYPFVAALDWVPGVYVAHLRTPDAPPLSPAMDSAAALFVVRSPAPAPLLYKLPLATWQAYNVTGGGCFYHRPPRSIDPPGACISLQRPGGGIGGEAFGAPDAYEPRSARQTFAHWDAPFLAWLAREGHVPAVCTDLDLHTGLQSLDGCRLLLQAGHDEYWTEPVRDLVETFIARGGNAAFFGGNLCWWRIHVVGEGRAIVCHQGGPQGALDHWWPQHGAHRPEDALTGTSYRHGGGWWDGLRHASHFVVQNGGHWAFAGTGLRTGDRIDPAWPPLAGYECDGVPLAAIDALGIATVDPRAGVCGTPASLELLAVAPLDARWQELPHREFHGPGEGPHAATMVTYRRGGEVFTAGTTDWTLALDDPIVARITRNVIERLLS